MPVKLVEVTRAGLVESIHRGDLAVVNSEGQVVFEVGNPDRMTFFRSSAKPLQAIAALQAGIAEKYNFDLKEIAVMVSSHSGEKEHIEVLEGIMSKMGVNIDALECGIHEPINKDAAKELYMSGKVPTKLHCNCSGKHLGVIAAAKLKGIDMTGYSDAEYSYQNDIKEVISLFGNVKTSKIAMGIDGCGIPVYGMPLKNMALAYANLCYDNFLNGKYKKSQNYVTSAMTMYPEMVAGKGRFDTVLMQHFGDRIICKFGAEGLHCTGVLGKGIGIALKIEDGNSRAVSPVVLKVLVEIGVIKEEELQNIKEFWKPSVNNHKGEVVGEINLANW